MLISTKGRYAVRIMLDVAQNCDKGSVKIADISARQDITVKYAEQITALLVKGGLLRSVRGAGGGYSLLKKPYEYRISEILYKTEGDLAPVDCVTGECPRRELCATKGLWEGLYRAIDGYLSGVTLQDLLDSAYNGADNYYI